MIVVRANWVVALLVLGSLLSLSACESSTEIVMPSQTVATNQSVTVSDWVMIESNTWTTNRKVPDMNVAGFIDSAVTNSVVEDGLVVAFFRASPEDEVYPLPVMVNNHRITFTYYAMNDKGIVSFQQDAGQPVCGEFRWVVVPKGAARNVDWADYSAVKRELGLNE
ncbi:hypothetical protein WBJ53_17275 [Spirosoma sp. SC4-14]|uniref:hypothetical protein n=1 Tax=Spirosoma sp. SC4-14 TaxID=3128900 RepID=UPI0030D0BF68